MKKGTSEAPKTTFREGQRVVYPLQGVGRISSIEEREFQGTHLWYYVIYLEVSDMTVMVPVERAEELGIRAIVSKKEAERALKLIQEPFEPVPADWKMRYQMNHDLLKQGSVTDIATVVRSLYHRSKIKELPILERKLFDNALKLLVDEVAFSLDRGKSEIEELVFTRLEKEAQAAAEARKREEEAEAAQLKESNDETADFDEEFE